MTAPDTQGVQPWAQAGGPKSMRRHPVLVCTGSIRMADVIVARVWHGRFPHPRFGPCRVPGCVYLSYDNWRANYGFAAGLVVTWRRQVLLGGAATPWRLKAALEQLHAGVPLWEVLPDPENAWRPISRFALKHVGLDPDQVLTGVRTQMAEALKCLLR